MIQKFTALCIALFLLITLAPLSQAAPSTQQLFKAIKNGDVAKVQKFINEGADIHATNKKDGRTPLHYAAYHSQEIVKLLIEAGADVHAIDQYGRTPLHSSVDAYHGVETANLLLEEGADINATDKTNETPLHRAATADKPKMVKFLIDKGANIHELVKQESRDGYTALHLAASSYHNTESAKHLIEAGADLEALTSTQNTPLLLAAGRDTKLAKLLIEKKANIHAVNKKGKTPLHKAVCTPDVGLINLLIEKGANIHAVDHDQDTPLHIAAHNGNEEAVKLLINQRANITVKNNLNETPLHKAVKHGFLDTVQVLVNTGADIHARDKDGKTPLDAAMSSASWNKNSNGMVKYLIKAGAEIDPKWRWKYESNGDIKEYNL